ncbi:MAG TPA: hypothetical protein PLM09_01235 [Casimicrobiaceae bacterium]|nr:hypothetical protein [Casimicrobiaceae bacterium]
MLDAYVVEVLRCRTINEINRLHIRLEVSMTAADICAIIDGARARRAPLPPPSLHWLDRMDTLLRGGGRPVQGYVREAWSRGINWYAAPGDAAARAGRRLVIAFTADTHRLLMPISLFLQHCPADRLEFLVLMDLHRAFYLKGVDSLGTDLPTTIAAIAARFPPAKLRRAVCIGTSAGGLAAVWAAVELGAARAISVGGVTPQLVREQERMRGVDVAGFEAAIRRREGRLPEVLLVSGDGYEPDQAKARAMQELLPAAHIVVPESSQHNALFDAWNTGRLDGLMERFFGDPPPATP